jgi:aspartate racemase
MKKVGLLATTGTVTTQLYQQRLKPREVLLPDAETQEELMDVIYGKRGIKLGFTRGATQKNAKRIAQSLINRGAQGIIAGCTELSLVLREKDISVPLIDPLQVLALAIMREAKSS